ncbi:MAG TPA: hypothetical protein VNC78_03375 [Actinomycetota bacterium]|nr:hypothetical protein [Actinomycetota bacterium]
MAVVVAASAVIAVALPASGQRARPPVPCGDLDLPLNRWSTVSSGDLDFLTSFPQRPCSFIGATKEGDVLLTDDAGAHWDLAIETPGGATVQGVVTEEAPVGTAFVLTAPPLTPGADAGNAASGLLVTRDFGTTFEEVERFRGFTVTALTPAPTDPQTVYAAAGLSDSGAGTGPFPGGLFKSTDFGATWTPLPGSAAIAATKIAIDPVNINIIWANSDPSLRPGALGGLWMSTDGGTTFTRVNQEDVRDLDTAALQGAARVDVATPTGIQRSVDQGATFSVEADGRDVAAVAHEPFLPQVILAIIDGVPHRSIDQGATFEEETRGLSDISGCDVVDLTRNDELTAYFILSVEGCGAAGHYLYRNDGRDVLGDDYFSDGAGGGLLAGRRPRLDMAILAEIPLPPPRSGSSGSVAFDGERLYYTERQNPNFIHMMSPDGVGLGNIVVPPEFQLNFITYDQSTHSLWSVIGGGFAFNRPTYVYRIDLETHSVTQEFEHPLPGDASISWDPDLGVFRGYQHHGYEVYEIDRTGKIMNTCEVSGFPADPNVSLNPDRGHPESPSPGFASGIAVGHGNMYLQLEDDRTMYYVDRNCHLLSVMEHRRFQESSGPGGENDQLACDTVTFGRPAIWIREAGSQTMVAYAVPGGYCPLDSRLDMTPERVTGVVDRPSDICATLREGGTEIASDPIAQASITFFVGDDRIGSAITDRSGMACLDHSARRPGITEEVLAKFYGNVSYRPSDAEGLLDIAPLPPEPPPPPPPPPVPIIAAPIIVQAIPQPPVQAPPEVPAPQAQPQAQSQAQAQAALAQQEQQQPQLAFVNASREFERQVETQYAMSAQREAARADEGFKMFLLAAALMTVAASALATSRVRTASALAWTGRSGPGRRSHR